jgi:hypothetical protein
MGKLGPLLAAAALATAAGKSKKFTAFSTKPGAMAGS